jgi:hypothetical protein
VQTAAGGRGTIGTGSVAKSPPDGQTLILAGPAPLAGFLTSAKDDIAAATNTAQIDIKTDADFRIDVELPPPE